MKPPWVRLVVLDVTLLQQKSTKCIWACMPVVEHAQTEASGNHKELLQKIKAKRTWACMAVAEHAQTEASGNYEGLA